MTETSGRLSMGEALALLADNLGQEVGQLLKEDFTLDESGVSSQRYLSNDIPTKHLLLTFPARFYVLTR
jgi:hypothetical protein